MTGNSCRPAQAGRLLLTRSRGGRSTTSAGSVSPGASTQEPHAAYRSFPTGSAGTPASPPRRAAGPISPSVVEGRRRRTVRRGLRCVPVPRAYRSATKRGFWGTREGRGRSRGFPGCRSISPRRRRIGVPPSRGLTRIALVCGVLERVRASSTPTGWVPRIPRFAACAPMVGAAVAPGRGASGRPGGAPEHRHRARTRVAVTRRRRFRDVPWGVIGARDGAAAKWEMRGTRRGDGGASPPEVGESGNRDRPRGPGGAITLWRCRRVGAADASCMGLERANGIVAQSPSACARTPGMMRAPWRPGRSGAPRGGRIHDGAHLLQPRGRRRQDEHGA